MRISFLNFELGYSDNGRRMQGNTGLPYGTPSKWNGHAQEVFMEFMDEAQYLKVLKDLKDGWHLFVMKWVPVPDFEALSCPAQEFDAGYRLAMDGKGLPDDASHAATLGWGFPQRDTCSGSFIQIPLVSTETQVSDALDGKKFHELRAIARELSVEAEGGIRTLTAQQLKDAIRAKRAPSVA